MPLEIKGNSLHGGQAYRLENESKYRVLNSNDISGHPVYKKRLENIANKDPFNVNKAHAETLSNFIANKLRFYASPDTKMKLERLIDLILRKRESKQNEYKARYMQNLALYKERVETLRAIRKFLENYKQPVKDVTAQIENETRAFTHATNLWVRHQDQIKYWRWIKTAVVPRVLNKISIPSTNDRRLSRPSVSRKRYRDRRRS